MKEKAFNPSKFFVFMPQMTLILVTKMLLILLEVYISSLSSLFFFLSFLFGTYNVVINNINDNDNNNNNSDFFYLCLCVGEC